MAFGQYVAYIGTYTKTNSIGIHIYDIDDETWSMKLKKVVKINNPSNLAVSKNGKFLYSIADEGVQSFRILEDGDLEPLNTAWTGGMRGCYITVDDENRYLFVAGFYDGRVTMMHLNEDGSVGQVACAIYHEALGLSVADKNFSPHVTCVEMTPDQKYLCAVDSGLDHVKVYEIDYDHGSLELIDTVRGHIEHGPRMIRFRAESKTAYILCEKANNVLVYKYTPDSTRFSGLELIQELPSCLSSYDMAYAASGLEISPDGKHLFASNAGVNTVSVYEIEDETGLLKPMCDNKTSGDYPKTLEIMPDNEHFVVLNHGENEMRTFKMNYEKGYFLMDQAPVKITKPNCIWIHKLR